MENKHMTPREKFILAQAFYKAVGKELKTGEVGNARWRFESALEEDYRATKAKSFYLMIGNTEVGTASRSVRKAAQKPSLDIVDEESFRQWAIDNLTAFYQDILAHCVKTGEVPDGCAPVYHDPEEKASWTLTGLDIRNVADAVRTEYGIDVSGISGLLEGGE